MATDTIDPYAPPQANLATRIEDAGDGTTEAPNARRGERLLASIGDSLVFAPGAFPVGVAYAMSKGEFSSGVVVTLVIALLYSLALGAYQLDGFLKRGQTIGKRWRQIAVVRIDGRALTFGTACARGLVVPILSMIPFVGNFVSLANALFIFGAESRCLHDHIAGTRVVVARNR